MRTYLFVIRFVYLKLVLFNFNVRYNILNIKDNAHE